MHWKRTTYIDIVCCGSTEASLQEHGRSFTLIMILASLQAVWKLLFSHLYRKDNYNTAELLKLESHLPANNSFGLQGLQTRAERGSK